jgi:hypothetical protein
MQSHLTIAHYPRADRGFDAMKLAMTKEGTAQGCM